MNTYSLYKNPAEEFGNTSALAMFTEYVHSIGKEVISVLWNSEYYVVNTTLALSADEMLYIGVLEVL